MHKRQLFHYGINKKSEVFRFYENQKKSSAKRKKWHVCKFNKRLFTRDSMACLDFLVFSFLDKFKQFLIWDFKISTFSQPFEDKDKQHLRSWNSFSPIDKPLDEIIRSVFGWKPLVFEYFLLHLAFAVMNVVPICPSADRNILLLWILFDLRRQ